MNKEEPITVPSKDGQHAYVKVEGEVGKWKTIRLSDRSVVNEFTIPNVGTKASKHAHNHPHSAKDPYWDGKGKEYMNSYFGATTGSSSSTTSKHVSPGRESPWARNWCEHDGTKLVFAVDGREFYGAGFGRVDPSQFALVLDLASQLQFLHRWTKDAITLPSQQKFMALNKWVSVNKENTVQGADYTPPPLYKNVVYFNWPDMGIIRTSTQFWEELYQLLPKGKILVACLGSHGRTGTALAALMMASGYAISAEEAVLTVRAKHCPYAIEHSVQLEFLDSLAGFWNIAGGAKQANKVPGGKEQAALDALHNRKTTAAKKG